MAQHRANIALCSQHIPLQGSGREFQLGDVKKETSVFSVFLVATALPTFGFCLEKPGQSASSRVEDAAGMPYVPAPAQTSVPARFVCNCLSVCGLLRLDAKYVAQATET